MSNKGFCMRILRFPGAFIFAILLCCVNGAALGQLYNYRPLDHELTWYYEAPSGATWTIEVAGEQLVLGQTTTILLQNISVPAPQVVHNYWTADKDGNAFLHGAHNFTADYTISYDPPILWLQAPLAAGNSWSTVYQTYHSLDGSDPGDILETWLNVETETTLTVTAGSFYAYSVTYTEVPQTRGPDGAYYDLLGVRMGDTAPRKAMLEWYSDGVGLIQMDYQEETFELISWNGPVPVAFRSWGGFKSSYR
ncbi:MAG: hypothetical protein ABIF77_14090 [bacterium]